MSTGIPDSYSEILPGSAQDVLTNANLDSENIAVNLDSKPMIVAVIYWKAFG